jgi:hypothetical protein
LLGLINSKIIARTNKGYVYYINPSIVFNGSRVTFMTTYVKKQKELNGGNSNQKTLPFNEDFLAQNES